MALKIAILGVNQININEIENVVRSTVGSNTKLVTATLNDYHKIDYADLYVCLINRKTEFENIFGEDKVIAMELAPPTEYFLQISMIPANSRVLIFNNSTSGTNVLIDHLNRYGLTKNKYEVIAYDELPDALVAEKISQAQYILGSIAYVGEGSVLHTKFSEYLAKDAIILVSPQRIATADSVSELARRFSNLYHKQVLKQLRHLSTTDYLTQMPNRRTFDKTLRLEWRRAKREKKSISLVMIDIDFFKEFNDKYGHLAGDDCIKEITTTIKYVMQRPADFCARFGGEEFAVILPNTDLSGAHNVMEKLRKSVIELQIKHESSTISSFVTTSIGLTATIPSKNQLTLSEFLNKADKALYLAKHRGRNTVVSCTDQWCD